MIMINAWTHLLHTRAFFMIRDKCRALDRKREPPRTKPVKLTEKELGAVAWLYTCATLGNYSSVVTHKACSFLEKHAAHFTPEDVSWIAGLIRQTLRDADGGNESDRARWKEALHALECAVFLPY